MFFTFFFNFFFFSKKLCCSVFVSIVFAVDLESGATSPYFLSSTHFISFLHVKLFHHALAHRPKWKAFTFSICFSYYFLPFFLFLLHIPPWLMNRALRIIVSNCSCFTGGVALSRKQIFDRFYGERVGGDKKLRRKRNWIDGAVKILRDKITMVK